MKIRSWFASSGTVTRGQYFATGAGLAVLKYAVDAFLIEFGAGQPWLPQDYVRSAPYALNWPLGQAESWLLPALFAWTVPFLWIGVMMTSRRLRDAGWSGWLSVLFLAPYLNYALMAALCLAPTARAAAGERRSMPGGSTPPGARGSGEPLGLRAAAAIGAGLLPGAAMTAFGVMTLGSYGSGLFFGAPFVMGACAAFVFNRRTPATRAATHGIVCATVVTGGASFLLSGVEGAVCLVMVLPLAIPVGLIGGVLGRTLALERNPAATPSMFALLAVPFWMAVEPAHATGRILHEVRSAIEIAASPDAVWPRVIAFDPLPPPTELVFRLGVAAPERAYIEGAGVGAVRYCVFSTGAFVEPITRWEPGRRLSFDVSSAPAPMREWSPYPNLHPPHLDGVLRSRRGEFRLVALAGGRTRLEGSTWYELQMAPEGYWQMISDDLIHRIHMRVLSHIKDEAERGAR